MHTALLIAAKDLRQRLRDRSAYIIGIAAPLALATVFSVILPDFEAAVGAPNWGVVDEDGGVIAAAFADDVLPVVATSLGGEVVRVADREGLEQAVEDGSLDAGFILPVGLSGDLGPGPQARIEVVGAVGATLETLIAEAVAEGFASQVATVATSVATAVAAGADADTTELATVAAQLESVVRVETFGAADRVLDLGSFLSAGMAIMFLFFIAPVGVLSLLEERSGGTLLRLHSAPISAASIVMGKAITSLVIGLVSMAVLATATTLLLGASWGAWQGVALLIVCAVVAVVSLVGVIAAVARTPEQASVAQSIVAVVLAMAGGVFFPLSSGPGLVETVSLLTPHQWFMRGLGNLAVPGSGAADVVGPCLMLLAFAAVGLVASFGLGLQRAVRP